MDEFLFTLAFLAGAGLILGLIFVVALLPDARHAHGKDKH